MKKTDRHHLLVYGMASKGSQLELAARTYFSESEVEIKKITTEGKTYDDFLIYLNKFLKFKYPKGGGGSDKKSPDSPTDDIGGLEYIVVIGIVSGEPRFAMSLRDFLSYKRPDGGSTATIPLTPKSPEGAAVKLEKMAEPLMVTTN